jgi:hypothetical protein
MSVPDVPADYALYMHKIRENHDGVPVTPPVVTVEDMLIAATRKQGGSHDHRKVNHARGVADALAWVLSGTPRPVAGTSLRDLWEDARPPRS